MRPAAAAARAPQSGALPRTPVEAHAPEQSSAVGEDVARGRATKEVLAVRKVRTLPQPTQPTNSLTDTIWHTYLILTADQ